MHFFLKCNFHKPFLVALAMADCEMCRSLMNFLISSFTCCGSCLNSSSSSSWMSEPYCCCSSPDPCPPFDELCKGAAIPSEPLLSMFAAVLIDFSVLADICVSKSLYFLLKNKTLFNLFFFINLLINLVFLLSSVTS